MGTGVGTKVGTFEGFEGYFSVLRKIKKARKPLCSKGLRGGAGERNRTGALPRQAVIIMLFALRQKEDG